jgi:hypothetical protein
MDLRQKCVVGNSNKLAESVVNARKNRENSTHREYVVEVRNNIVSQNITRLTTRIGLDLPLVKLNRPRAARIVSTDPTPTNRKRGLVSTVLT